MKRIVLAGLAVAVMLFAIAEVSIAIPIAQASFGAGAITYGFDGASIGQTTVTSGNLTVTNGVVRGNDLPGGMSTPTYYDGGDSSVIRFDFASAVSAVGMSVYANNQNITLSVYNNLNALLEAYEIDWRTLPNSGYPYGFIGLAEGSNSISYALIDTPLNGNELYIDNVTYQSAAAVPEPATVLLLGGGLVSLAFWRRKRT